MAEMYEHKEYASKGMAGAALGLGIAGTALALGLGNGGFGLFGNNRAFAAGAEWGMQPSAFGAWQKGCEDAVALTRAIYDTRIKDLEEKTGIYNYFNQKLNVIDQRLASIEAAAPYEKQIIALQAELAKVNMERYVDKKTCNVIYGEPVLPTTPTVTGITGVNPCGCPYNSSSGSSSSPAA